MKWCIGGNWYKADHMGYEALSEIVISRLLKKSSVTDFVSYFPVKIIFNGREINGCRSENFKLKNESVITLERLSRTWLASSFPQELLKCKDVEDKIKRTVAFTKSVTKLPGVGKYLTTMLELDAFFLNEDRHTNNIAFIFNEKTGDYRFCPYFDFGLSLLSDTSNDYPMSIDLFDGIKKIKAKPFSLDFDEQLDAASALYGNNVRFYFSGADIEAAFEGLDELYTSDILTRAKNILHEQKRKYRYMFD